MEDNGHWGGIQAEPDKFFGFLYLITHVKSGRMYIGKKQYYTAKQKVKGCKSKITDRQSPKWKLCCWKESDWRTYKGSSNSLAKFMKENPDDEFTYTIIRQCRSRGTLHYGELKELWKRDVLAAEQEDGSPLYWNLSIGAIKFRPPKIYKEE